ncbi:MAG: Bax inhibitor-1 family protein, partial [Treponema sp.]|nr:Bax inhibitor-1 family protein [Treponema sp.]
KNLATAGHYLMMALIGLVIVTVVNRLITFFTHTPLTWLDWLLSVASVIIFTGLTAYDAQKIAMIGSHDDGSDAYKKISIYGALQLYLDFINIFLSLLRLFGKKR